jgi:hypothetical protein
MVVLQTLKNSFLSRMGKGKKQVKSDTTIETVRIMIMFLLRFKEEAFSCLRTEKRKRENLNNLLELMKAAKT